MTLPAAGRNLPSLPGASRSKPSPSEPSRPEPSRPGSVRAVPPQGYGRWETGSRRCSLTTHGESRACRAVRLEQNVAGVLTVRFLADGANPSISEEELLFVGELKPGQNPMQCTSDGRCEPSLPTLMHVSTVAASRYDTRGLIVGLPRTHLVQGSCELNQTRLTCQASQPNGLSWLAEARP